jgi:hypothetical protein
MVTPVQLAHVESLVNDAVNNGAKVLVGGRINKEGNG